MGVPAREKDIIKLLRAAPLFSPLSDEELSRISAGMSIKRFKKNEIILYEQDTNAYMYVILSGKVKAVQMSEDGKETILAIHRAGEFFGEMSLIDGRTMPATVIATEDTLTAIISRTEFQSLIFSQQKLLEGLLRMLCTRLRKSWELVQILNFKNSAQRIKMLLCLLSSEYGKPSAEGITLGIKLTHQDIANMVGIARETVTRVIDKWQKDKEIKISKNRHISLSADFLERDLKEGS